MLFSHFQTLFLCSEETTLINQSLEETIANLFSQNLKK